MIKKLLLSSFTSFAISQAQAMMDPDDDGTSSSTSTTRQQPRSGEAVPPAAHSRDPKHNPQQDDTSTSPQDESKALRDQNAALREQNSDLEARLAALESNANEVQIGAPRNIYQVHVASTNHQTDDELFDDTLYGENLFVRDNPYLEK